MTAKEKAAAKRRERMIREEWGRKKHTENTRHYIKNLQQLNIERAKEFKEEYKQLIQAKYDIRHEAAERRLEQRRQVAKQAARQYVRKLKYYNLCEQ